MKKCLFFFTNPATLKKPLDYTILKDTESWGSEVAIFNGTNWTFYGLSDSISFLQDEVIILLKDSLSFEDFTQVINNLSSTLSDSKNIFVIHTLPSLEIVNELKKLSNTSDPIKSHHTSNAPDSKYFLLIKYLKKEEYKSKIPPKTVLPANLSLGDFIHIIEAGALPEQSRYLQIALTIRNVQDGSSIKIDGNSTPKNKFLDALQSFIVKNPDKTQVKIELDNNGVGYTDILAWEGLYEFKNQIKAAFDLEEFEQEVHKYLTILT